MLNALELRKLSKKSNLKKSGVSYKQKTVPESIIHKIFETNSSFHVKQHTVEKAQFLFLRIFLLVLTKFSFQEED